METYYELIEESTVIKKVAVSEMIDEFFKNGFQNSDFKELGRYATLEEGREALSNYKCSYSEASRNELYFHAYYLEEREEADGECESTGNYDFAEIEEEM